jgi:predicted nucleotidyltransferase
MPQQAVNDVLQIAMNLRAHRGERSHLPALDAKKLAHARSVAPGSSAREKLVENDARSEEIGRHVERVSAHLLGRHIAKFPFDQRRTCPARAVTGEGDSEVHQLHFAFC